MVVSGEGRNRISCSHQKLLENRSKFSEIEKPNKTEQQTQDTRDQSPRKTLSSKMSTIIPDGIEASSQPRNRFDSKKVIIGLI